MSIKEQYLQVKTIFFESNDQDVIVTGLMIKGTLQYCSEIVISQTQLNHVLNQLQKLNPKVDISDYLEVTPMYNDLTLYSADFSLLDLNKIDLYLLSDLKEIKEIRA